MSSSCKSMPENGFFFGIQDVEKNVFVFLVDTELIIAQGFSVDRKLVLGKTANFLSCSVA